MTTQLYALNYKDKFPLTFTTCYTVLRFQRFGRAYVDSKLLFCNVDVVWPEHAEKFLGGGDSMQASHGGPSKFTIYFRSVK